MASVAFSFFRVLARRRQDRRLCRQVAAIEKLQLVTFPLLSFVELRPVLTKEAWFGGRPY
jgi:hypothetical protein